MKNILSILFVAVVLFSCSENKSVKKQTTFCNPMNLDYGCGTGFLFFCLKVSPTIIQIHRITEGSLFFY